MTEENKSKETNSVSMTAAPAFSFYPLFEHMSREHGLTLLDSELHEICLKAAECNVTFKTD